MKKIEIATTSAKLGRNCRGSLAADFAAGLFAFPIVTLLSVNIGLLGLAAWTNDAACRDAARAAGEKHNETDALVAARNVVRTYAVKNGLIQSLQLNESASEFTFTTINDVQPEPNLIRSYVKVTTQAIVKTPVPVIFNGTGLQDTFQLQQSYTFPVLDPAPQNTPAPVDMSDQSLATDTEDTLPGSSTRATATESDEEKNTADDNEADRDD